MAFIQKLDMSNKTILNNFIDAIFFDCDDRSKIFLTIHSEQIKGETPWPAKSLDQLYNASQNNTFHYCISTFDKSEDERLRRRITQFNALHVIVLDDIGTKVKPPQLPPSYIVETSKDNYQYGYILNGAIRDRNIANALIYAIYDKDTNASDAGGKAITKMVKLPIGVNLKEGRDNFPVTLTHFDDTLRYDYYDILKHFDLVDKFSKLLTSGKLIVNTNERIEHQLADNDTVFQWLSDNNHIVHDNGNGYFVCNCPRGEEHSDNNPSSGSAYKPLGYGERPNERHFKCHHEHAGLSPSTDEFLMWVREQGGPSVGRVAKQSGDKINYLQMAPMGIYPDLHINPNTGKSSVKQTIENLQAMLHWYGLTPERNVYKDEILLIDEDNRHFTTTDIYSISKRNMLPFPAGDVEQFIEAMSVDYLYNPVLTWLKTNADAHSTPSNAIDTVFNLLSLSYNSRENTTLLRKLWRKWVIQCVAAADASANTPNTEAIPKYESTLIFVGGQGIKKTSFLRALIPPVLRSYFAEGVLLNLKDKDSVIKARSYWICELGELDATFRRSDISELKAYLSSTNDQYRAPYARVQRTWPRRTSFCASVNESKFLHDFTGNRRFWTIELEGPLTWPTQVQIELMWAEAYHAYITGEPWWVDYDDTQAAENYTRQFSSASDEWFVTDIYRIFGIDDDPSILIKAKQALNLHKTSLLYEEHNKSDFKAYTTQDLLAMSEKVSMNVKPNRYTSMLKCSDIPSAKLHNNRIYFVLPKKVKKY